MNSFNWDTESTVEDELGWMGGALCNIVLECPNRSRLWACKYSVEEKLLQVDMFYVYCSLVHLLLTYRIDLIMG